MAPAITPFTFHSYAGEVPPLVPFAVYVTVLPMHVGLDEATTEMLTGWTGLTFMVIAFDVTWVIGAQGEFDTISQVTISPFAGA